jgi:hypothetical protein
MGDAVCLLCPVAGNATTEEIEMTTMNKPASDSTSWYTPLTDNWTAIENNLLHNSLMTTKGDLIIATGASSPTRRAVGANGKFLKADSSDASGTTWGDVDIMTSQDAIDILWGKKFFQDEGFLPSTKKFEYLGTPPAFAGTAGSATWTRDPGAMKPSASGIGWYDLGSAYSQILIVCGNILGLGNDFAVCLTSSAPTGVNPDGYSMWKDGNGPDIWRRSGGVWTRIDSSTGLSNIDYQSGFALYYDDSTNVLKMFLRMGGQWFLTGSGTDSTFTTMRYVSFQAQAANTRWATPFVCYAQ